MKKKRFLATMLPALLILTIMFTGCSQSATNNVNGDKSEWPNKPVNIIVPAAAGGGTDTNARLVAKYLTQQLGQPVTITNINGSSGAVGLKEAKNSAPNGYTFVYFNEDTVTNEVLGVTDIGYKDFKMVGNVFNVDMFLVGSQDITDVKTLIRMAKEKPGGIIFGGESGAFISLLPYIINKKLDIQLKIVDGGQMNERLPMMVGRQINMTFAPMQIISDYIKTNKLTAIALLGDKRSDAFPDIPTAVEQGLDIIYNRFQCIMAPKGVDDEIVEKFSTALKTVSENAEFIKEADKKMITVRYTDGNGVLKLMEDYHSDLEKFMQYIPK